MKKILFILTLFVCLFSFTNCKRNRIDHEDSTYIYVWKYDIHGDSCLYKYHKPIYYHTKIIDKKRRRSRYGKTRHTSHFVLYEINGKIIEERSSNLYFRTEKGTRITVQERFYPYYDIRIIEICK